MAEFDFERYWLNKFSVYLDEIVGSDVRQQVMQDSNTLSQQSERQTVIEWTHEAMDRLERLVTDEDKRRAVMTGCACQYPKSDLQVARQTYEQTDDLDQVHNLLQEKFEIFLADTLKLEKHMIEEIVSRGWGLAGIKCKNRIIATKIPKSGYLVQYMNETDPDVRRQYYCHCSRVRDALKRRQTLPATYCYCGAGYYKGIWEEILQQPVKVEVLESVLQGNDVCKVAIELPI